MSAFLYLALLAALVIAGPLLVERVLRRPEPPEPNCRNPYEGVRPTPPRCPQCVRLGIDGPPRFDVTTARRELVADETLRIVAAVFPEQREAGEWS